MAPGVEVDHLPGIPWSADFLRRIAVPGAPEEIGVAVSIRPGAPGQSVLVSYNPRRRDPAFRLRIGRTLKAMGFPIRWLVALSPLIPPGHGSWVLGVEAEAGRLTGTLYIEELSRFFSPAGLEALWRRAAGVLALPGPAPIAEGDPYILAVDFGPSGATCLKRYHLTPPGAALPILQRAPMVLRDSPHGHILQRRGSDDRLKLYRCYPYRQHPDSPLPWRDWQALTGQSVPPLGLPVGTPVTSIGARLSEEPEQPDSVVLYTAPVIGRSSPASSPNTAM